MNRGPLEIDEGRNADVGSSHPSGTELTNTELETSESMDTEIVLSCLAIVQVSDEEETCDSEEDLDLSADEMVDSDDGAFVNPPKHGGSKRKRKDRRAKTLRTGEASTATTMTKLKKNYNLQRRFHTEWVAKEPWSEAILAEDGVMHLVRCRPCSVVRGKPVEMAPKWDTISKHAQREIHKKCMLLYAARGPMTVAEQIQGYSTAKLRKKRVQFATLFQLLSRGRPMTEFESRLELYEFLNVPNLPRKHWADKSGWIMAEHLYDFVKQKNKPLMSNAAYWALSADETSACDNSSWIAIHGYVLVNWCRVPLLLSIQKMDPDGATASIITTVIIGALTADGGVTDADIAQKLLSFGADGVNAFQGLKTGVTSQIKEKFAPFSTGVHCCAHRLNLAAQSLFQLTVMHAVEEVLRSTHAYFAHSPKKAAEFRALCQQLESKGLKLLKNVKTRWMNCLGPIRRLLAEYKGVIATMLADKSDKKWGQRARVSISCPLLLLFRSVTIC